MQQFVDQTEVPPDPEQAQGVLADQVNLLGLKDKSSPAVAVMPAYDIGPIHSPAVTRLEDADIPDLPANLAKQRQQAATAGTIQAMPEAAPVAPPKEAHPDLPAPDQIPRAKMPVLDFHSVLEQMLPAEMKPSTPPAHAPDKPAHAPLAPPAQPQTVAPEQAGAKAALPGHPAATPALPPAPIELYRPRGAPAPDVLPPAGGMRITPHPAPAARPAAPVLHNGAAAATAPVEMHAPAAAKAHAPSDTAAPTTPLAQPAANPGQADTAAHHAAQAPHRGLMSDDRPLPPEAIGPQRHLPQSPTPESALIDRPPARLRAPHIIVPVRPILPRPPINLDRPPGVRSERLVNRPPGARLMPPPGARLMPPPGARLMPPPGARLMPPPGAHLMPPPSARLMLPPGARLVPHAPDADASVQEGASSSRDRPARQEDRADAMPPSAADPAP